ncbi:GTP-binding protein [Candidatus Woesearchaeota archaeon]|nr:GTP-binding protein [Candidatus Woesearchaeota archaeon]
MATQQGQQSQKSAVHATKNFSNISRIAELEAELKKTDYNKRTQYHVGLVKAKIAMLKEKELARGSKGPRTEGYAVRKSGDATVVLLGFPSAGKSSLLNAITNAHSPVGAYEFTTLSVIPGLLEYKNAKIQVLDVPGIVHGAASGRGRGREVLAVLQSADLALIIVDVLRPHAQKVILKEVYDSQLRLNARKPDVKIKKTARGGIRIGKTVRLTHLTDQLIESICKEMRISNAEVLIRTDITVDELIDAIEGNKRYIPAITALNKIDLVDDRQLEEVRKEVKADILISAETLVGMNELKELIFDRLNFMRVFCKEVSKKADLEIPLIMRKNATIEDLCGKLHRDFVNKFKFAKVWGKSAKFDGQRLMLQHTLMDGDVVEIHLR